MKKTERIPKLLWDHLLTLINLKFRKFESLKVSIFDAFIDFYLKEKKYKNKFFFSLFYTVKTKF
jgi:hypothetical protein